MRRDRQAFAIRAGCRRFVALMVASLALVPVPSGAQPNGSMPLEARSAARVANWPSKGEITFDVLYGKLAFKLGSATHRWQHDGHGYRMESIAKASGLLASIDALSYTQRSRGDVGRHGLRPQAFEVERGGKRREWSAFDWEARRVDLVRDGATRHAELAPGDQDVLSLWHQIGLAIPLEGGPVMLTVVTGKSAAETRIEDLGEEPIEVPAGRFSARHLRAAAIDGSLTLDVWLASERHWLPVRIRMQDRKGEILDQQARSISLETKQALVRLPEKK